MVFSSMTFLWIFLPSVLAVNYAFSFIKREKVKMLCKNVVLLLASLIFLRLGRSLLSRNYSCIDFRQLFVCFVDRFCRR